METLFIENSNHSEAFANTMFLDGEKQKLLRERTKILQSKA